ncbi:MAG: hypothetical protein ACLSGS_11065 [Adlercreutzia sp.]
MSFQFAIAAAVRYSRWSATASFFFAFLGGVLVGVALGLTGLLVRRVRSWGSGTPRSMCCSRCSCRSSCTWWPTRWAPAVSSQSSPPAF